MPHRRPPRNFQKFRYDFFEEIGSAHPELFRQFQPLSLIIRGNPSPVKGFRAFLHVLIDQTADHLAMFQHEGGFVAAHFQHAT
jgi:hypothetical protein